MKKQNYGTLIVFSLIFVAASVFITFINNSIMNEIESAERQLGQTPEIQVINKVKKEPKEVLEVVVETKNVTNIEKTVDVKEVKKKEEKKPIKPVYEMPLSESNLPL